MRLISQDGKIDIPYENCVVYVLANYYYNNEKMCSEIAGYIIKTHTGDDYWDLGVYSTKEKALKVMEMLQQQYLRHLTTALVDVRKETTYFKFPPDEEVK